jgi:formate dehydrogenase
MWAKGFFDALGSPHYYAPASQDTASRYAASALAYGSSWIIPIPDLYRTDFLLMIGANPLVSHGSLVNSKRIRETLSAIVGRGGRIVVVDPRRTETASVFEHLPVRPDTDAWMLLSMLHVIFTEKLEDREAINRQARGAEGLRSMAAPYSPEVTEERTGIPAARVRELARDLAGAERAAVYGRCGANRGRSATLVAFLIEALNVVTGNLDREGGSIVGSSPVPDAFSKAYDTWGKTRTRIGGFPDGWGLMPSNVMAKEMLTPGEGQIRAFFTIAGNPISSSPNPDELAPALEGLDLHVAIDLYLSDTAQYADYVLPATTMLEREDVTILTGHFHLTPHVEWTDPVIPPRGEARQEWQILDEIARRAGFMPFGPKVMRLLARAGMRLTPKTMVDIAFRLGPNGDLYGLRRSGLNVEKLRGKPHGVVFSEHQATGVLRKKIRHRDKLVRLDPPEIFEEVHQLTERHRRDPSLPLSLIGMRELRSLNSWMHNSPKLMIGATRVHTARIHPTDAAQAGIADGELVRISSRTGTIELPARLSDEMIPGAIAVPHGWGHRGGWQVANEAGGANFNRLASTDLEDIEALSGTTHLDGIPVRIEAVR